MTSSDVSLFVRTQISEYLKIPLHLITADQELELLGLDSLGALELVLICEDKFDIPMALETDEINITTVGDAIDYVAKRLGRPVAIARDDIADDQIETLIP